jgi:hypothetical protein
MSCLLSQARRWSPLGRKSRRAGEPSGQRPNDQLLLESLTQFLPTCSMRSSLGASVRGARVVNNMACAKVRFRMLERIAVAITRLHTGRRINSLSCLAMQSGVGLMVVSLNHNKVSSFHGQISKEGSAKSLVAGIHLPSWTPIFS